MVLRLVARSLRHLANYCSPPVGVWASDSFDGIPAGTVHRNDDDEHGRPSQPVCGARGRLFYFASSTVDDVPPTWRCPDCAGVSGD
jgi:hypothetical protein